MQYIALNERNRLLTLKGIEQMEYMYTVRESGIFEFWGTLSECQAYILANQFKDSFFTIERD